MPFGLHALLERRRDALLSCWMERTKRHLAPGPLPPAELLDRMPAFVDQIIAALGPEPGAGGAGQVKGDAAEHGSQRLRLGFDVAEVIREYGILHACVLEMARDAGLALDLREVTVLATWVNAGVADAVSQYTRERDGERQRQASAHLGFIAHELRNPLTAALMALQRLRRTDPALGGGVVDLLERNLRRTAGMIENALVESSLKLGVDAKLERVDLSSFLRDIAQDAALEAQARRIAMVITTPDELVAHADPRLLRSAIINLVINALKFSRPDSSIEVEASRAGEQVVIAVADSCGGLPPGKADELFRPLVQRGENRTGYGLGLAIALQAVEAHGGTITLRDVPGQGCVFRVAFPSRR